MTTRPTQRHANILLARARYGYNEDQLARFLGVTRETMRGWAKTSKHFADALDIALHISRDFWMDMDEKVRRRELRDFPKQHHARVNAERKAELDAMSPDERNEQAKARRREQAKTKRA